MKDDAIRARIQRALQQELSHLEPTAAQREKIYQNAVGGNTMKIRPRPSFGLILAIVLMLVAVTATAAVLLSAQQVVEETAVPMALENDTPVRRVESYTPEQVAALIRTANENGITLSETTGIIQALKKGEGYYEDEAIMEICREAFGGIFPEWTIEEQHWFMNVMMQVNGDDYSENDYCMPGPEDMTVEQARAYAAEQLKALYPDAAEVENAAVYMRQESFVMNYGEDEEPAGPIWRFQFLARDLTHPEYTISFDREGKVLYSEEDPAFASHPFSAGDLVSQIHSVTRSRHHMQYDWDQNAWHLFREYLPQANQSPDWGWGREQQACMLTAYPLPDENDIPMEQAISKIKESADAENAYNVTAVLMEYEGRRFWKVVAYFQDGGRIVSRRTAEIDSRTGDILTEAEYSTATPVWANYVPQAAYEAVSDGMLREEDALKLAMDALREALGDDAVPFDDPACFRTDMSYLERRGLWRVQFRTKDLRYGNCAVEITEPDRQVTITALSQPTVDGDTVYTRYTQVYGGLMYAGQDVLIQMADQLRDLNPTGWKGKLLQKTVYPPLSEAKIPLSDAIDIAAQVNGWPVTEELGSCLLGTEGNPVWKFMLDGEDVCWMYEVDAVTGEILDRTAFKPDNSDFDDPIQRITLRRDFMPAYVEEFGIERAAAIEVTKAFADMIQDEPMLPLLDTDGDDPPIVHYETVVDGRTVTFRADQPGCDSYRVEFTENWLPLQAEIIEP